MYGRTGIGVSLFVLLAAAYAASAVRAPSAPTATLHTVTLLTDDFPAMLPFYRDVLGLELERLSPDYAEFRSEGARLHLTTRATMRQAVPHERWDESGRGQSVELAFSVATPDGVDAFYRRVVELGATPVQAPADVPWGQRVGYFADPDGNIHDVFAVLPQAGE